MSNTNVPNNPALVFAIIVEILSQAVTKIAGTKADGTGYEFIKQEGYVHTGHGYPDRFEFILGKDENGYPRVPKAPGFYAVGPSSFRVEKQRLGFGFDLELIPLPAISSAADLAKAASSAASKA
jgi:hypothetical protein